MSFFLSCLQGRHCHLPKFHIYVLNLSDTTGKWQQTTLSVKLLLLTFLSSSVNVVTSRKKGNKGIEVTEKMRKWAWKGQEQRSGEKGNQAYRACPSVCRVNHLPGGWAAVIRWNTAETEFSLWLSFGGEVSSFSYYYQSTWFFSRHYIFWLKFFSGFQCTKEFLNELHRQDVWECSWLI